MKRQGMRLSQPVVDQHHINGLARETFRNLKILYSRAGQPKRGAIRQGAQARHDRDEPIQPEKTFWWSKAGPSGHSSFLGMSSARGAPTKKSIAMDMGGAC